MHPKLFAGTVLLALGLSSASAITVAGFNFQDNAFADTVVSSSGTYTLGGAPTLQAAVTGPSLTKFAFSPTAGAFLQLGFTDNYLVNGPGFDLALFEYGNASTFSLTVGAITHSYLSVGTGFTSIIGGTTYQINVAQINLDDFIVAPGAQVSNVRIGMDNTVNGVPSLGVAGALNSQSVPDAGSTVSLLGMVFLSMGWLKRKL